MLKEQEQEREFSDIFDQKSFCLSLGSASGEKNKLRTLPSILLVRRILLALTKPETHEIEMKSNVKFIVEKLQS